MKKAECRDGARLVGRFVDVPRLRSKWAWLFFVSRQARRNKTVASDLNRFRRRFFTAPTSIALRVQAQSVRLSHASALSAGPSNRAAKVGRKPLMECAIWVLSLLPARDIGGVDRGPTSSSSNRFAIDSPLEGAVSSEPVSACGSLLTGKNTGNCRDFRPRRLSIASEEQAFSMDCESNSLDSEQGRPGAVSGNWTEGYGRDQGKAKRPFIAVRRSARPAFRALGLG